MQYSPPPAPPPPPPPPVRRDRNPFEEGLDRRRDEDNRVSRTGLRIPRNSPGAGPNVP